MSRTLIVAASPAAGAAWIGLAAWHPETTYHLAPAVAMLASPLSSRFGEARPTLLAQTVAVLWGVVVAAVALVGLNTADLLRGPVLGGGDPVGEALIVGGAALIGAVTRLLGAGGAQLRQGRAASTSSSGG